LRDLGETDGPGKGPNAEDPATPSTTTAVQTVVTVISGKKRSRGDVT
jgi:hypothetical protein